MEFKTALTRVFAVGVAATMLFSSAACGNSSASDEDDNSLMTVEVFDGLANYQGEQKGWFAKIIKDKFNIKLNIVAPNVAGGGSTLFDTRAAAGNLGDIVIYGYDTGKGSKLVKSGLIEDMTPYLQDMEYINKYKEATDYVNEQIGKDSGVWGIPSAVVENLTPDQPSEGLEPTFGPYLRWDLYKEIGYPEINTLEDLVPVLKQMQDKAREEAGSDDIYAMSLFKDWDGNMMNNAKQPTCFYGYDEVGFVLAKGDGSDFESITEEDGIYERTIKFFNAAYRAGIVDPESTTQNYDTMNSKYKNGKVLFSFWPWLGQAAYNTNENKADGKGFMLAPLKDMKIFSYGAAPRGDKTMIALGSKAKNKQRLVKFINWLYSPEGVYASSNQTGGSAGVEGLTWEVKDGKPVLTDFGSAVLSGESKNVPDEWGGGSYSDGISALNFTTVNVNDIDPNTGYTYNPVMWPSEIEKANQNPLNKDWQEHMGASTTMEYLENNNMLLVGAGSSYVQPEENSQISTLRGSIKTEIINSSWKASFADSESECEKIFSDMIKTAQGLDIDSVLEVDMKNAKDQDQARKDILKEYQNKKSSSSESSKSSE